MALLVATGRVLIMPKYQLTNPKPSEGERLEERTVDIRWGAENSKPLHFREIERGKRDSHFGCWSWCARRLAIFFGASTWGSGAECFKRAAFLQRTTGCRRRRRPVAAAAMEVERSAFSGVEV